MVKISKGAVLLASGLEDAFVGIGRRCGQEDIAVYSIQKAIEILKKDGITEGEDRWRDSIPATHRTRVTSLQESERWTDFWSHHGRFLSNSDLTTLSDHSLICVGNHLANHWDTAGLTTFEFREEFMRGQSALGQFPNALPWYAPPHGTSSQAQEGLALELGATRVFRGSGRLNPNPNSPILDRIGDWGVCFDNAKMGT